MSSSPDIASAFDIFTSIRLQSSTLEKIWSQSFGDEYAIEARPNGFYTKSVLDRIVSAIGSSHSGGKLLDIGCGHGLTGLYIARQLHMELYGIDVSQKTVSLAKTQADTSAPNTKATFWVADATSTGLQDGSCDLVMSLDVLLYLPDRPKALAEIARVLRPDGRFAFTTWEHSGYSDRLGAEQVNDYRPLLEQAGLSVESYETVAGAREIQDRFFENVIENADALNNDIGEKPAAMFVSMATSAKAERRRYVFGMARRK